MKKIQFFNIKYKNKTIKTRGITLVEVMVTILLLSSVMAGIYSVFASSREVWMMVEVHTQLQDNLRQTMFKVSRELRQTGSDNGVLQLGINNGGGVNNSDVITFSIPICVCSNMAINNNGNISNWGAPLVWGSSGCITDVNTIVPGANGGIDICHLDPANPGNTQSMNVPLANLGTHLAHNDWRGQCNNICNTNNNAFIVYAINPNNQLVRRILDNALIIVQEDILSLNITDLQANLNGDQNSINLTVTASRSTKLNRQFTRTINMNIFFRNRG